MTGFSEAWDTLKNGNFVSVSDGTAQPPRRAGPRWWIWYSHNFVGELVGRRDATPRKLLLKAPSPEGVTIIYEICESQQHTFEMSDAASFASVENGL